MTGMHHVVDSCPGYEIDGRGMVSLSQNSYFNPNDTTQSENTNNTFFNMAADRNARKSYDSLPSASRNSLSYDSSRPSHRSSSLAENLRPHPPSPRAHRQPSLSQAAVMELLNHPSNLRSSNPLFAGRDWREIRVGELVSREDVRIVERDTPVEEATKVQQFHNAFFKVLPPPIFHPINSMLAAHRSRAPKRCPCPLVLYR